MATATITILFCDLVGSTAFHARLGDDAAGKVRRACFAAWRDAIERHRGREVKSQGDGFMVAFGSASDAIAAAVALQRATARVDQATRDADIALRVGVSVGEATEEDGDWFGTPVNEAARLCAAAAAGRILVSDLARALVGPRGGHEFVTVGPLELKGIAEPFAACEVAWRDDADAVSPLPPALVVRDDLPFVGREDEMARLREAWQRSAHGDRQLVVLAGEPGIGKTRLVAELAAEVAREGFVFYGRCTEDYAVPMQPIVEALGTWVTTSPPEFVAQVCGETSLAGELTRVLPTLSRVVSDLPAPLPAEPDTARFRLFEAVAELLGVVSRHAPILFVVDDLHWAPRLQIATHLLHSAVPMRIMLVGTYRDTELGRTHPLGEALAEWRRLPGFTRLALRGLTADDVRQLVEAAAPAPNRYAPDQREVAREIHAETEGNPFFVGEVLRNLAETGHLDETFIPEGVRQVIGQRVNRLPVGAGDVLSFASVIGQEFDAVVLAAAADMPVDDVLGALAEAEQARLVVAASDRPGRYGFDHALVRSTLYSELPTAQRLRTHRRVARALEGRGSEGHLAALAYHYGESAALGDVDRAIDYACRAAEEARGVFAFDQAAAHYAQALAALDLEDAPDAMTRCDLLIARGDVLRRIGDRRSTELLEEAEQLARAAHDGRRVAAAVLAHNPTGLSSETGGVAEDIVRTLEETIALLGDADPRLRARLLGSLGSELLWHPDHERRLAVSREAAALARAAGDRSTLASVLVSYHDACSTPWNLDERLAIDRELIGLRAEGDLEAAFAGHRYSFEEAVEMGDGPTARAHLAEARALADTLRQPFSRWSATVMRVALALIEGDFATSARLTDLATREALDAAVPDSVHVTVWAAFWYMNGYERGTLEGYRDVIEQAPAAFAGAKALLLVETGRAEEGRGVLESAEILPNFVWYFTVSALARLAVALEDRPRAAHFYDMLAPFTGRVAWFGLAALGPVDSHLAVLAPLLDRDPTPHHEAAIAVAERLESPPFIARGSVEWAAQCARMGNGRHAEELARRALDIATRHQMQGVAAQARALLP